MLLRAALAFIALLASTPTLAQPKLARLVEGDAVVLLVDDEGKVTDVAIPPRSSESDKRE